MLKLLSALLFAAFVFGLVSSSATYACNEQTAQAEDAAGLVQLAMDESEEESDDGSDDEGEGEGEGE